MQKWKILIETNEAFAYSHLRILNKKPKVVSSKYVH